MPCAQSRVKAAVKDEIVNPQAHDRRAGGRCDDDRERRIGPSGLWRGRAGRPCACSDRRVGAGCSSGLSGRRGACGPGVQGALCPLCRGVVVRSGGGDGLPPAACRGASGMLCAGPSVFAAFGPPPVGGPGLPGVSVRALTTRPGRARGWSPSVRRLTVGRAAVAFLAGVLSGAWPCGGRVSGCARGCLLRLHSCALQRSVLGCVPCR
jgi:hypothetical protein